MLKLKLPLLTLSISMSLLAPQLSSAEPLHILPLGDSITNGVHNFGSEFAYRDELYGLLKDANVDFDFLGSCPGGSERLQDACNTAQTYTHNGVDVTLRHEGRAGWKADDIAGRLDHWLDSYANGTPDVALIHIGTNDIFQLETADSTITEIKQIVDILLAKYDGMAIYLAKIIPMGETAAGPTVGGADAATGLNNLLTQAWANTTWPGKSVKVVDMNALLNLDVNHNNVLNHFQDDMVHPNQVAEEIMAQKWFDVAFADDAGSNDASPATSTLSATPETVTANDADIATITLQAKNISGTNLTSGGDTVVFTKSMGSTVTMSDAVDNDDGTYTTTVKRIRYAGKLTMRAKINGTFLSSSTEVNFDAGQTIKLAEEPNLKTFGDPSFTITDIGSRVFNTDTPLTLPVKLIVKSSSSEVCDINNSKEVTIKSAGDCTLVASQSGGDITDEAIANFTQSPKTSNTTTFGAAADVEKTIEIKKANQTITVTNTPTTAFIGDIFPVTAISDSTLPVTIVPSPTTICTLDSTNKVTIKAAGTCKLTADQAGNDNYKAAATVIYNIKVSADSITFPTISDKTYGSAPFSVTATSSSGANVSLSSETTNVCAVSGTTVTLVAVGTCKLKATSGSISNTAEFKVKKNASQLASESIGEVIASGTGKVTTAQLKAMGVKNVKADKDYTDAIKKGTYANINPTQAELQTVIDKANSDDNKSGGSTSPLWLLTLGFVALFRRKEQS